MEADHRVLDIWFTNRVAEYLDHEADWRARDIVVHPLHHWPGTENIADIATKGLATVEDVLTESNWQRGPPVTQFPKTEWPISREFVRQLPECLVSHTTVKQVQVDFLDDMKNPTARLVGIIRKVMKNTNRIRKVFGVIARIIQTQQTVGPKKVTDGTIWESLKTEPTVKFLLLAEKAVKVVASMEVDPLVKRYPQ